MRKLTINWAQTKWEQHAGLGPLCSANTRIGALVEHVNYYYRSVITLLKCVLESCGGGSREDGSAVFSKLWEAADLQQTAIRRFLDKNTDEIASSDELVMFRRISTDLETSLWLYEDICTSHVDGKYGPEDAPYLSNRIEAFERMQNCLSTACDSSSSIGSSDYDSDEDFDQGLHSPEPASEGLSSSKGEATQHTKNEAPAKDSISEAVGVNDVSGSLIAVSRAYKGLISVNSRFRRALEKTGMTEATAGQKISRTTYVFSKMKATCPPKSSLPSL